jgi:myotubularin-related protein 1/2
MLVTNVLNSDARSVLMLNWGSGENQVVFLGIDNIHAMRDSLARLRDFLDIHGAASSDGSSSLLRSGGWAWGGGNATTMSGALSALGDSGWLVHCHTVLIGAAWIAARIALEGASVLVHCRYVMLYPC